MSTKVSTVLNLTRAGTHGCALDQIQGVTLFEIPEDAQLQFTIPKLCTGVVLEDKGHLQVRLRFSPDWQVPEDLQERLGFLAEDLNEVVEVSFRESAEQLQTKIPSITHLDYTDELSLIIDFANDTSGATLVAQVKEVINRMISESGESFRKIGGIIEAAKV